MTTSPRGALPVQAARHDFPPYTSWTARPASLNGDLTVSVQPAADDAVGAAVRARWVIGRAGSARSRVVELTGSLDWNTGTIRFDIDDLADVLHLERPRERPSRADGGFARGARLTTREREVATLLARGASNATIATTLGISPHTARHHTEGVMQKLGAVTRAQVGPILRGDRA